MNQEEIIIKIKKLEKEKYDIQVSLDNLKNEVKQNE